MVKVLARLRLAAPAPRAVMLAEPAARDKACREQHAKMGTKPLKAVEFLTKLYTVAERSPGSDD
jgi:hypothetical protein